MKYDFDKVPHQEFVDYFKARYSNEEAAQSFCPFKRKILTSAEVKLRTRAEVDADIASLIRYQDWFAHPVVAKLNRLCKEETKD